MVTNPKLKMQEVVNTYSYLKLISLIDFDLWDTKRYTLKSISSAFDIVELGTCINEENKKYKLYEEENKYFGILGVNNKEGIFDNYIAKGKEINQAYKKMDIGWLAYNPYRINVGSIGVRLKEHKNEYISPAYVVFSCNENILPEFLFLLFKTNTFNKIINKNTTGSVRQNLTIDILKKLKIPLPSLIEQENIINAYNSKITEANILQKKVYELEKETQEYFLKQLGIEKSDREETKTGLQIFEFMNIDRWDVWVNKNDSSESLFKTVPFKSIVIGKPMYGANVKGVKHKSDTRYIRTTDINENGNLNDEFVSPEFVEEKYLLKENDFLISRSGTVGRTFLFKEKYGRAIYAGYLVKYNIDYTKVVPQYLLEYTKSYTFKNWVISNQRIATQPNINGQEYLEAPFIIPPIPIQIEIVEKMTEKKNIIQEMTKEMESIRVKAQIVFEKELFN